MKFKIREKEGLKYSNISGDKNKIHIELLYRVSLNLRRKNMSWNTRCI